MTAIAGIAGVAMLTFGVGVAGVMSADTGKNQAAMPPGLAFTSLIGSGYSYPYGGAYGSLIRDMLDKDARAAEPTPLLPTDGPDIATDIAAQL